MQVDSRFRISLNDINIEPQHQAALENLWNNEVTRGQIVQLVLQILRDSAGFSPQEIGWLIDEQGYVLTILVANGPLEQLTREKLKTEIFPAIKEKARTHRDFKPAS